jgi:hypothetical protein
VLGVQAVVAVVLGEQVVQVLLVREITVGMVLGLPQITARAVAVARVLLVVMAAVLQGVAVEQEHHLLSLVHL